ncbi:MAG TPA: hypothetical protein PLS49_00430 [Candidatus Woesebacteria bacterium]|nr:hypothetical protein [Candidatus Woesebacteria bacterium]
MKYIATLFIVSVLFIFNVAQVSAANSKNNKSNSGGNTRVRGNVYDQVAGTPINGLPITVSCNGITKTANTDGNGLYVIDFTKAECDKYEPVSANATFNGEPLSMSVLVSAQNTATMDLNFGLIAVPEFGMVTGVLGAVGSGVAFLGLRKRFG